MYAQGAASIRTTLLNGASNSTEAGVTFFASAVIAGSNSNNGGDDSNTNVPTDKDIYTTKWVDVTGRTLSAPTTSETGYGEQKTFDGYTYKSVTTDDATHTKTYVYSKNVAIKETTDWVDEAGNTLKATENGTKPDNDRKSDIDGYVVVSTDTTTDADGNKHTINVYHKVVSDTVWVDEAGKVLKEKVTGEFPDNDGKSDIDGYDIVDAKLSTDKNGDRHITNIYKAKLPDTYWYDTAGNTLKEKAVGQSLPDNDGKSDIEGYTLANTYTVLEADIGKGGVFENSTFKVGDVINIYTKKNADPGKVVIGTKEAVTLFNKKGVEVETDRNGDIRQNTIWSRKYYLAALTDATKAVKILKGTATATADTTVSEGKVYYAKTDNGYIVGKPKTNPKTEGFYEIA